MIVSPEGSDAAKRDEDKDLYPYEYFGSEHLLFEGFLKLVYEWDPDIFVGYEVSGQFKWD